jgi:hypothetical protein
VGAALTRRSLAAQSLPSRPSPHTPPHSHRFDPSSANRGGAAGPRGGAGPLRAVSPLGGGPESVGGGASGPRTSALAAPAAALAPPAPPRTPSPPASPPAPASTAMASSGVVDSAAILAPVAADMEAMNANLRAVVGDRHPMLVAAAEQIFGAGGKRLRPALVFLVARATAELMGLRCVKGEEGRHAKSKRHTHTQRDARRAAAWPASPSATRDDGSLTLRFFCSFKNHTHNSDITDKHRRLAEITEMIHTASLVHDDVLDDCDTRRGERLKRI